MSGEIGGLKSLMEKKRKLADEKASEFKQVRDDWNNKTKEHLTTRNDLNSEVKKLNSNMRTQRDLRNQKNKEVREKKKVRSDCNVKVREAKEKLKTLRDSEKPSNNESRGGRGRNRRDRTPTVHSLTREYQRLEREFKDGVHTGKNESKVMKRLKEINAQINEMKKSEEDNVELKQARDELRIALEEQEASHLEVTRAAEEAQQAHDLMIVFNDEVSKKREAAEEAHHRLRRSKNEADRAHHHYIVSIRCLRNTQQILRAMKTGSVTKEDEEEDRVQQDSVSVRELSEEEFESGDEVLDDLGL